MKSNVFICPPCGESVALATKEGQNKNKALWPLLPRLTAVLPPQGREMSCGFTLIELLVVVLIIGILAAVAVPQYQKAVLKSRMVDAIGMLRTIQKAQEVYYLNHGNYTTDLDDLDIEIPANQKATSFAYSSESYPLRYFYSCHANGFCIAAAQNDNLPIIEVHMMHAFSGNNNQMTCAAFKNNTYNKNNLAEKLCRSMGPVSHPWEGTVYYEIR